MSLKLFAANIFLGIVFPVWSFVFADPHLLDTSMGALWAVNLTKTGFGRYEPIIPPHFPAFMQPTSHLGGALPGVRTHASIVAEVTDSAELLAGGSYR